MTAQAVTTAPRVNISACLATVTTEDVAHPMSLLTQQIQGFYSSNLQIDNLSTSTNKPSTTKKPKKVAKHPCRSCFCLYPDPSKTTQPDTYIILPYKLAAHFIEDKNMNNKTQRSTIAFLVGIIALLWPSSIYAKTPANAGPDKHPQSLIDTLDA
ncbi:hypothetical protein [Pseudomonas jessenii]|nr:hypothetical protein [Pseudomonas jessenii]